MLKKTLVGISLAFVIAISGYGYLYKGHRDISSETANYVVTVSGLEKEFSANDSLANLKYEDKTIALTATVTAVDAGNNSIVLGEKISATFKDPLSKEITLGKTLKIKGRFLGYDELLEEFKIDQTSLIN